MLNTREIDKIAQDIFSISIPPAWLIREQHPDIHIDYFIEIADGLDPSGILFGVQLKGTSSPNYSKGNIKISIKTKHLIYYLDKIKQPIFIIVVDVESRIGYYIFIQEYLVNLSEITWRHNKFNIINLKRENMISNIDKFKAAIINADSYMRELWPSSIDAAISFEKKRLENLDPRFKISISHKNGQTHYGLHPKENVEFKCSLKVTRELKEGIANYCLRGLPFSIDASDILDIKGSDIITETFAKSQHGKVIVRPNKQVDSSMVISTINKSGVETAVLYNINGYIAGGKREFRFQGQLTESPFRVSLTGRINKKNHLQSLHFTFNFEFKEWEGLSILHLPFFDKIFSFFKALIAMDSIKMLCEIKGMPFLRGISNDIDYEDIKPMYNYLFLIQKARIIAKELGITFSIPRDDSVSKNDVDNIEIIYQILTEGEYRRRGLGVKFDAKITPNEIGYKFFVENANRTSSGSFRFEKQDEKYEIFGKEISLGILSYELINSRLVVISDIEDNKDIKNIPIDIQVIGTESSELIIRKISE